MIFLNYTFKLRFGVVENLDFLYKKEFTWGRDPTVYHLN